MYIELHGSRNPNARTENVYPVYGTYEKCTREVLGNTEDDDEVASTKTINITHRQITTDKSTHSYSGIGFFQRLSEVVWTSIYAHDINHKSH